MSSQSTFPPPPLSPLLPLPLSLCFSFSLPLHLYHFSPSFLPLSYERKHSGRDYPTFHLFIAKPAPHNTYAVYYAILDCSVSLFNGKLVAISCRSGDYIETHSLFLSFTLSFSPFSPSPFSPTYLPLAFSLCPFSLLKAYKCI